MNGIFYFISGVNQTKLNLSPEKGYILIVTMQFQKAIY
jgi:hypothetical protein